MVQRIVGRMLHVYMAADKYEKLKGGKHLDLTEAERILRKVAMMNI